MILVTTNPFNYGKEFLSECMESSLQDQQVVYNGTGCKYSQSLVRDMLREHNPEYIIAGTEQYGTEELDIATNLKMISRVGVGYDSVDLQLCDARGIAVAYTPMAPAGAVAELTIQMILRALRRNDIAEASLKLGEWVRPVGRSLKESSVGVIGCGRIGSRVINIVRDIVDVLFTNDIDPESGYFFCNISLNNVLFNSDVVTIHIPLNEHNKNFITKKQLDLMRDDAVLLNLSRGGIVNEDDLLEHCKTHPKFTAVVDTFVDEPYSGPMLDQPNIICTPHIGSCTHESRKGMEIGAVENMLWHATDSGDPTYVEHDEQTN